MQCHKMQAFPFDLVFHAVIRRLKCKAVLNIKKEISIFLFLYLFSFRHDHVSNIAIYATQMFVDILKPLIVPALGLVWLNHMQPTLDFFPLYVIL